MRRFVLPIVLLLAGVAVAALLVPAERAAVSEHLALFPGADAWTHQMRPAVLGGLCLLPALGALLYALAGTLDRYVLRQFLALLAITFGALAVIWLLLDLEDNITELKAGGFLGTAADLYAARFSELVVTLLPYALLLALLFALGRISASREIIAMIQTGRGVARLTAPLLVVGLFAAAFCAGLNYHWAPRAVATEEAILDRAMGLDETAAEYVMFRNPRARRLWMVGAFSPDYQKGAPLRRVRVIEEDDEANLRRILVADSASWSPDTGGWSFSGATLSRLPAGDPPGRPPVFERDLPDPYVVKTWRETPAEIIQPGLPVEQLGVPDLAGWLADHPTSAPESRAPHLTQWHHRIAQPFNCLIVVLLATPLGIVFSRRGTSGGVALAVFLAAGLLFLGTISLSLGETGYLAPALAAWLPNLVFGVIALYLFRRRLAGRPIYQVIRRLIPDET